MSTLSPYNRFINEDVIDGDKPRFVKGEKKLMKLFISKKMESLLRKLLKTADFQAKAVASRILNIDQVAEDNQFDISYLDIDPSKEDSISYIPAQRAWGKWGFSDQLQADTRLPDNSDIWTSTQRQSMSIGKLVNKLFDDFSEIAVDKFVTAFRAEISAINIYDRFKLVTGENIRYWYAESNYFKDPGGGKDAGLNTSCMRYDQNSKEGKNCQSFFDIYVKNPEKCALLILTNQNNKLLGRALVWSNLRKPTDRTFMDRIYVHKQSDAELFKKYAMEQGWIYKYDQQAYDHSYMDNGQRVNKSVAVQLKPAEYKSYPFMDTLKYYNPTTGRLGSDPGNPVEGTKRWKLEGGGGAPQRVD